MKVGVIFCRTKNTVLISILNHVGLSLINTLLGIVFGNYGFVFVYHRQVRSLDPSTLQWLAYAFIFHRFLLIGGDLFPSLDRCVAILFPLKYYMVASPCCAFGKSSPKIYIVSIPILMVFRMRNAVRYRFSFCCIFTPSVPTHKPADCELGLTCENTEQQWLLAILNFLKVVFSPIE